MRAIIDIFLSIIFSIAIGSYGAKLLSFTIKREALITVSGGIGSLEKFTQELTTN